jgi:cell division protein FtsZ
MEEMTEASERIYNEVGENADIIWGAVVDDSMGDEMSVTVIATGIGEKTDKTRPDNVMEHPFRGRVRDITPSDLENIVDYDQPTFIRRKEAVGESGGASYRGYKGIVIDNSDLEVPTFLRRKAD